MVISKTKKLILISIIGAFSVIVATVLTLLLLPQKPGPRKLLSKADSLTEQNLCLMAILEQDPQEEESWRQLLINYLILEADPLTVEATKQAAEAAVGHTITLPDTVNTQPEKPGSVIGTGGIIHAGCKVTDYRNSNSLATDGETVYLATNNGIEVDYQGLRLPLTSAKAERMIATENGLYYLNATADRVQYIARDGHCTETVSELEAADFAFYKEALWIVDINGKAIQSDYSITELCVAKGTLYGACEEGLVQIGKSVKPVLSSPVWGITGGENGCIYYIDTNGFPAEFDPTLKEAVILKEKTALGMGISEGKVYYLNSKLKIKKCGKF